jgi:hypothetical protein
MKTKIKLALACAVTTLTASLTTHAGTLTTVPMQGGMAMPMVSYNATMGSLHVMMPADIPILTPLLVSNPDDSFDPADPWFDSLDPSRQSLAFSRRYGFVMNAVTDPLPANTAIWIRKNSSSPELEFYRYAGSEPKLWEPIFGTAQSPNALFWNGMMFHPGVAAPAGTNSYSAMFELYLVDTTTGLEIPGTTSGPLEFNWTSLPDGRPQLEVGRRFIVSWPADATGYILEWADSAASNTWTEVTDEPVMLNGKTTVVLGQEHAGRFYRMRQP